MQQYEMLRWKDICCAVENMGCWSTDDVCNFLQNIGCEQYQEVGYLFIHLSTSTRLLLLFCWYVLHSTVSMYLKNLHFVLSR